MKKLLLALLFLSLVLVLVGCNKEESKVETTTTEIESSTTAEITSIPSGKYIVKVVESGRSGNYLNQTIYVKFSDGNSDALKLILQGNSISFKFELDDIVYLFPTTSEILIMYNIDDYEAPIWGYGRIG